jgi:hypothetical protein
MDIKRKSNQIVLPACTLKHDVHMTHIPQHSELLNNPAPAASPTTLAITKIISINC